MQPCWLAEESDQKVTPPGVLWLLWALANQAKGCGAPDLLWLGPKGSQRCFCFKNSGRASKPYQPFWWPSQRQSSTAQLKAANVSLPFCKVDCEELVWGPHCGSEISGPGPVPPNALVVFSNILLHLHENFRALPRRIVFSIRGRPALFWSPSGPIWSLWPLQRQAVTCSSGTGQAQASLQYTNHTALSAQTLPHTHTQAPLGAAFVANSIWFHRTWKRTRDTWHCPPISHVQDHLQTALRGSPRPTTPSRVPISTIVCQGLAFSQLTCLRGGRCEKLETNWLPWREGSFLVQKGRKYLCGISFFFPSSSSKKKKNTKRLSVLNGNVGFKSLRFGLTLQKGKKSDRLSDMTQKKFFPSIHVVHL